MVYNYGDAHRGEIIIDDNGNCLIGTATFSTNLTELSNTIAGKQDGLLLRFNKDLTQLLAGAYFGGKENDAIYSLKNYFGDVLIGGGTRSADSAFSSYIQGYRDSAYGGRADGYLALLNSDMDSIQNATYIGTSKYDQIYFVDYDRFGKIYGLGQSTGDTLLKPINAPVADSGAGQFIVKLNKSLNSIELLSPFGNGKNTGNINISPTAFLVDRCQNMFVSGWGGSIDGNEAFKDMTVDLTTTPDAFQDSAHNDLHDFYLYVLNHSAEKVYYATYFGAPQTRDHVDGGTSRFDKEGVVYQSICAACDIINGVDYGTDTSVYRHERDVDSMGTFQYFPGGPRTNYCNNSLLKFDVTIEPEAGFKVDTGPYCIKPNDTILLTITDESNERADTYVWRLNEDTLRRKFQNKDTTILITQPGEYIFGLIVTDTVCLRSDSKQETILVRPDNISLNLTADSVICNNERKEITINSQNANAFEVSQDPTFNNIDTTIRVTSFKVALDSGINIFYVRALNDSTNACPVTDTIDILYIPVTYEASIPEDTVCVNSTIQLYSKFQNIDRFVWDLGNELDSTTTEPLVNYKQPGDYTISLFVQNFACDTTATVSLHLNVQPNQLLFDPIPDTIACQTQQLELIQNTFGTAQAYVWSSNPNFTDTLNNFPNGNSLIKTTEGQQTFYIKILDEYCEKRDTVVADLENYELQLLDLPLEGCAPFTVSVNTVMDDIDNFNIDFGNGNGTNSNPNPTVTYTQADTFLVSLTGENIKCNFSNTLRDTLIVYPEVTVLPIPDTLICKSDPVILKINSLGSADQFRWSFNPNLSNTLNPPSDSTFTFIPTVDRTLYYAGINGICSDTDNVRVRLDSVVVALDDFNSLCIEDTIALEVNTLFSRSPLDFNWKPADSIIQANTDSSVIQIAPKNTFELSLISQNAIGCLDFDTVEIEVTTPAFEDAKIMAAEDSVFSGQPIQLSTNRNGANLFYTWLPAGVFANNTSPTPVFTGRQTTDIEVLIYDANTGCTVEAFYRVSIVEVNCKEPDIFVPTAFTPNNDGKNDVLYVRGDNLESIDFNLYNRWGEKVFSTTNKNMGWDGVYQGDAAEPGVFVYHLQAKCYDGQEYFKKGNVTLIR